MTTVRMKVRASTSFSFVVCDFRPKEEGAGDNPLIVVGVDTKDIACGRYSRMPTTLWAERAYSSGALDPSFGTSLRVSLPAATADAH